MSCCSSYYPRHFFSCCFKLRLCRQNIIQRQYLSCLRLHRNETCGWHVFAGIVIHVVNQTPTQPTSTANRQGSRRSRETRGRRVPGGDCREHSTFSGEHMPPNLRNADGVGFGGTSDVEAAPETRVIKIRGVGRGT